MLVDLTENLNMKVFLALTLTVLFAENFHCAPLSDDTQLSLFHVIASEDAFLEDELLDGFKSAATRQKRGAAEDMFALINGIFGRADRDGNHQLEIEEYWSTFKAFDLNEDGAITRNEYIGFMTSGRFPAMRMMGNQRKVVGISRKMFNYGDMDRNGVLDRKDAEIIFANLDKDGDEHISEMEYAARWQLILRRAGLMG